MLRGTNSPSRQTGFMAVLATPRIATSGAFDDGDKAGAADGAEAGDREAGALHVFRGELAVAGLGRGLGDLFRELPDTLAIHIADYRHQQPASVATAMPICTYFFWITYSPEE